jgi:hypothetical protein
MERALNALRSIAVSALFDVRATPITELEAMVAGGVGRPVAARFMMDTEMVSGEWSLAGARSIEHAGVDLDAVAKREKGLSSGLGAAKSFLDAYFSLQPWDEWYDPRANDLMLLPGLAPPPTRRRLRDVFEQRLVAACSGVPKQTTGPASIEVIIAYPGTGLPRVIDLPKPRQLSEKRRDIAHDVDGRSRDGAQGGDVTVLSRTKDVTLGL